MRLLIILCIISIGFPAVGQQSFDFVPSAYKHPKQKRMLETLQEELILDLAMLKGKHKDKMAEAYASRTAYISASLQEGEFIFGSELNTYVDNILQHILESNKDIPQERLRLFISRDISPNASCLGDGTMVFNIGLLRRLENESQVAFVICHELAHYTQNHVNEAIAEHILTENARSTQRQIKRITKAKYNRNKKGIEFLKGYVYSSSRHSRLKESGADAKAAEYLANTNYDAYEASKALTLLDEVDEEKYKVDIVLKDHFHHQLYPYQPEWKAQENPLSMFLKAGEKETNLDKALNKDSLKTHPNCKVRANRVREQLKTMESVVGQEFIQDDTAHERAVAQADFEVVLSAYDSDNIGLATFYALQLLDKYPDNAFLVGIIGISMARMVPAIDKHELGKILPAPSEQVEKDYNDILKFLNNLSRENARKVSYYYANKYADRAAESEALMYALALTNKNLKKHKEKEDFKSRYYKHFPKGHFIKEFRRL